MMLNIMNTIIDKTNSTSTKSIKSNELEEMDFLNILNIKDKEIEDDYNLLSETVKMIQNYNLEQSKLTVTDEEYLIIRNEGDYFKDDFIYENTPKDETIDSSVKSTYSDEKAIIEDENIDNVLDIINKNDSNKNKSTNHLKASKSINNMIYDIENTNKSYENIDKSEVDMSKSLPSIQIKNNNLAVNYKVNIKEDEEINLLREIAKEDNKVFSLNEAKVNLNNNTPKVEVEGKSLIVRQEHITADAVKAISYLKDNDIQNLKLNITPKNLGDLTINLTKTTEETNVLITLSKDESFNLINKNIKEIIQHLDSINIKVNQIVVEVKNDNQNFSGDNLSQQFREKDNEQRNRKQNKSKKVILENDKNVATKDENISILA